MKTIGMFLIALFFVSGCISEPRVQFGKKCVIKGDQVVYSYVWIHNKNLPLEADEITCEEIKKN